MSYSSKIKSLEAHQRRLDKLCDRIKFEGKHTVVWDAGNGTFELHLYKGWDPEVIGSGTLERCIRTAKKVEAHPEYLGLRS